MASSLPRILLLWPYGILGAESIPMCMAFLAPRLQNIADVGILDCSLNQIHPHSEHFLKAVLAFAPDIVGISSWSREWPWARAAIAAMRVLAPNAKIVLGGPHVTATNEVAEADYTLTGEAEWSFPSLVEAIGRNAPQQEMEQIPGLRCANQHAMTPRALVQDLDGLGLPDFHSMLLGEYQQRGYYYRSTEMRQAPILATRGCPYTCAFCEAPMLSGRKIRKHSIAYLKDLLLHLRAEYSTNHISIVDDNFSFYLDYAKEFCEMVLRNQADFAGMTFGTPNGLRVERSDPELWRLMKAAGWEWVIFAPESGSQRMVNIMAKHLDLGVIPGKVEEAHRAGLKVEAFFIVNYPDETEADVIATERFIASVPFDAIALHLFKPLPHTPIWRELVDAQQMRPDQFIGRYDEVDWLANGKTGEEIKQQMAKYILAAKSLSRIA